MQSAKKVENGVVTTVYIPSDLRDQARARRINMSEFVRDALRRYLTVNDHAAEIAEAQREAEEAEKKLQMLEGMYGDQISLETRIARVCEEHTSPIPNGLMAGERDERIRLQRLHSGTGKKYEDWLMGPMACTRYEVRDGSVLVAAYRKWRTTNGLAVVE